MGLLKEKIVRTKIEHTCHGCCEIINKRTSTYTQTCIYDGHIYTLYICDKCLNWCENRKCNECMDYEDSFEGFIKDCMKSE